MDVDLKLLREKLLEVGKESLQAALRNEAMDDRRTYLINMTTANVLVGLSEVLDRALKHGQ